MRSKEDPKILYHQGTKAPRKTTDFELCGSWCLGALVVIFFSLSEHR
jgi:hypothetical protein